MKTADDTRSAVARMYLVTWRFHQCAMCGSWSHYSFPPGGTVWYTDDCGCVVYEHGPQLRTWQSLADHYNRQTDPVYLAEIDRVFGWDTLTSPPETPC